MIENKNVKKDDVVLFFSCDDNYIPCFSVVLESIIDHADKDRIYDIHVIYTNISNENINRIVANYSKNNIKIQFDNILDSISGICEKLHTRDYYSKSTYYRLFIPNMYPEYDKVLYLDCDIVLTNDVAKLFDVELEENYVGAIPDQSVQIIPAFQRYVENRIGVRSYKEYFNAGILLMNLRKLREINFENLFIGIISKVTFNVAQDQDYLNTICRNRVHFISGGWNKMPIQKDDIPEEDVSLIHYNLNYKPWHIDGVNYEEYFWKYADKCIYADEIRQIKANYSQVDQHKSVQQTVDLIALCNKQADDIVENDRIKNVVNDMRKIYSPSELEYFNSLSFSSPIKRSRRA